MTDVNGLDDFAEQVGALEESLAGTQVVASAFAGELEQMRATIVDTSRQVSTLSGGISRGLRSAFDGMIFDGMRVQDAFSRIGESMVNAAYSSAVNPVMKHFGGMLGSGVSAVMSGMLPFAKGGSFAQGRVMPFARGGVVSSPTAFPMRGGTGLMGEAGPEAIMPLSRGPDGSLGVRAQGGAPVNVVMHVTTADAESFRRSQGQIAAQMGRALARGQRNR
ncbi:phage tail tape measure protein [Mangrovicoccus algicola]|uniref:Phage tail tape measure protein n=1 Tax=Mangrovicoccus algicola TaxID=2771008 RepID=A0A8J7D0P3_9RHOB|nr:phage tail tape measure protein [Mangrovicoccus algicola]MBE3639733.1 phage tail tape measure protein [Mangrovicoccus algicola]